MNAETTQGDNNNRNTKITFSSLTIRSNKEIQIMDKGFLKIVSIPISVVVEDNSFLHIGGSYDPLSTVKGIVFKVGNSPVIPATTLKGAVRYQLEHLLIDNLNKYKGMFNVKYDDYLKPCIPAIGISKAEESLLSNYRCQIRNNNKYSTCWLEVDESNIQIPSIGICPVCYFMGAAGIRGFLRFNNLTTQSPDSIIQQPNIRIDRKTNTAAYKAKVELEQVRGGTVFKGSIDIILEDPVNRLMCITFGYSRKINNKDLDLWLKDWQENYAKKRMEALINELLIPATTKITELGGLKSRGAGRVRIEIG